MPIHQPLAWPPSRALTLLAILGLALAVWFMVELSIVLIGSSVEPPAEQLLAPFRWQVALAVA
jgi:hypothetical protein